MRTVLAAQTLCLAAATALAAGEQDNDHAHDAPRREMGAHVHGQGALDVAVEGDRVLMAFAAPGADIVGFEHAATSDADRAAVEAAKARLADPLALFDLPAAGCAAASAEVTLAGGAAKDHEHDHGHDHASESHAEFHAEYTLECAEIGALTGMRFPYFAQFPNAQRLTVTIVSERGQRAFSVERGDPELTIGGGV